MLQMIPWNNIHYWSLKDLPNQSCLRNLPVLLNLHLRLLPLLLLLLQKLQNLLIQVLKLNWKKSWHCYYCCCYRCWYPFAFPCDVLMKNAKDIVWVYWHLTIYDVLKVFQPDIVQIQRCYLNGCCQLCFKMFYMILFFISIKHVEAGFLWVLFFCSYLQQTSCVVVGFFSIVCKNFGIRQFIGKMYTTKINQISRIDRENRKKNETHKEKTREIKEKNTYLGLCFKS